MQEKINSTLIGFDYGLRKIGVSIGNTVSGVASPLKILYSKSKIEGFKAAKEEVFFWDPELIVVGFPSHTLMEVCTLWQIIVKDSPEILALKLVRRYD